jgi:hypothetical protein
VVAASRDGRVATLFVAADGQRWGTYDESRRRVELHERPTNGAEDLLDRAALETLLHGGTVFSLAPEEMPGEAEIAAVLRY